MIEVEVALQAPFGWRIASDQDEVGVYVAAARRAVVGGLSSARFVVRLPVDTHLMLNLQDGTLRLRNINGTLEIPPLQPDRPLEIGGDDE